MQRMVACCLSSLYNVCPDLQVLAAHGAIYNPEESRTAAAPAAPAAEPVGQAAAQPALQAQLRAAVQPTGEPTSEQPAAASAAPGELCLTIPKWQGLRNCDSLVHHSI